MFLLEEKRKRKGIFVTDSAVFRDISRDHRSNESSERQHEPLPAISRNLVNIPRASHEPDGKNLSDEPLINRNFETVEIKLEHRRNAITGMRNKQIKK